MTFDELYGDFLHNLGIAQLDKEYYRRMIKRYTDHNTPYMLQYATEAYNEAVADEANASAGIAMLNNMRD